MVVSSCRELDNNRSALSAASAFAIATAGANEGTPTKEKYRRMSLASTGPSRYEETFLRAYFNTRRANIIKYSFKLYSHAKGFSWQPAFMLSFVDYINTKQFW